MKFKFKFLLICTMLCLFWLAPVQAQDEESEGVGVLLHITAKEGHDEALIKGITEYHHWVADFEGHMRFNWWKVSTGHNTGTYYAYSGDHDWADFDAKYDWEEKSNAFIAEKVMPHVESMTRQMVSGMDDVSHWPDDWDGYTHIQVTNWYVMNGQYSKFNRGLKRIVEALKAGGFPYHFGFSRVESGGHGGEIHLISPSKGWAGMSEEEPSFYTIMTKELGSQEAFDDFMADWGSSFKTGHNQMLEFMPKASDYGDEK